MRILDEIKLELFADYFQFFIQDENAEDNFDNDWTDEAVGRLLIVTDGLIGVGTVRNMNVPVIIKIFDSEPPMLADDQGVIGQINECDLNVFSGRIMISGCTDYLPDARRVDLDNGIYRARIYYANLDTLSEDGLEGDDCYEIHLWKTDEERGLQIIKSRNFLPN
ncbi:MAG: hypothetical protein LBV72_12940 [Tannerella sp.]|jgi:hypothetical protein|nr:hypothetical protein [Tannerella sp.]